MVAVVGNHSSNLHCVVMFSWWWWYIIYIIIIDIYTSCIQTLEHSKRLDKYVHEEDDKDCVRMTRTILQYQGLIYWGGEIHPLTLKLPPPPPQIFLNCNL